MSKEKTEKKAISKTQEKQNKLLSFVGGLVFFTVVMAVVVYKDEDVRQELGTQAKSLLKTSKEAARQLRFVVGRLGKAIHRSNKGNDSGDAGAEDKPAATGQYDTGWTTFESQKAGHVKNHLTG